MHFITTPFIYTGSVNLSPTYHYNLESTTLTCFPFQVTEGTTDTSSVLQASSPWPTSEGIMHLSLLKILLFKTKPEKCLFFRQKSGPILLNIRIDPRGTIFF